MLQGLLSHDTDAEIESNVTDTHGASIVGFGFCELLGFRRKARFRQIGAMRLYAPGLPSDQLWPAIAPVISARKVNWQLLAQYYDELIKYATALKLGTAEAQQLLRRFMRGGPRHPAHQALDELGRVGHTIYLCKLLASDAVRRDVHEARQVVETWNSGVDFIHYGKNSELTGDDREDLERRGQRGARLAVRATRLLAEGGLREERVDGRLQWYAPAAAVELTDPDGRYAYLPLDTGRLALDGDRTRGPCTSDQPRRQQARKRARRAIQARRRRRA